MDKLKSQHETHLLLYYQGLSNKEIEAQLAHYRVEIKRAQAKVHIMELVTMQRNLAAAQAGKEAKTNG